MTKRIDVWLMETSEPLVYQAKNTYTKGRLYCIYLANGAVVKFPLCNIFRIEEVYGTRGVNHG